MHFFENFEGLVFVNVFISYLLEKKIAINGGIPTQKGTIINVY